MTLTLKLKREQDCGELLAHHFSDIQVNIVTKKLAYMFNLAVNFDTSAIASLVLNCDNLPTKALDHSDLECSELC